jgi:small subunit ribosomal protein S20
MPHTRSAKKRLRQSIKRRAHNRAALKDLKSKLRAEVQSAVKKLDKAAARRIVHPNLAARKKSQLYRLLQSKEKPQ